MTPEEIKVADEPTLRARLAELKAMKRSKTVTKDHDKLQSERFTAAANQLMETESGKAMDLMAKAEEYRRKRDEKNDPDTIRFKIQSALNVLQGRLNGMTSNDREREPTQRLVNAMIKEQQLDNPSIKHAYEVANVKETDVSLDGGGSTSTDEDTETPFDKYRRLIVGAKSIDEVNKYLDEATTKGVKDTELSTLQTRAKERIGKLTPKGKVVEDKDIFKTFIDGSTTTIGSIAGATALGQSMYDKIKSAISRKDKELSQSDTQQLAAMIYQTYNPGALVGGEMSSAVGALKGSSAWKQYIDAGMSNLGIQSGNKVPIRKAIEAYNAAIQQGVGAFGEFKSNVIKYKSDPNTDYKFIDAYTKGMVDPSKYLVGGNSELPGGNSEPPSGDKKQVGGFSY